MKVLCLGAKEATLDSRDKEGNESVLQAHLEVIVEEPEARVCGKQQILAGEAVARWKEV